MRGSDTLVAPPSIREQKYFTEGAIHLESTARDLGGVG
jgi:hypothetical protein